MRSVTADVAKVVTRFCRARLADPEVVIRAVVAETLASHGADGTPARVAALGIARRAVATVIEQERPAAGSMQAALLGMAPVHADVLTMRVAVGATVDEVAAVLGLTPEGVLLAQHRALDALRAVLAASRRTGP